MILLLLICSKDLLVAQTNDTTSTGKQIKSDTANVIMPISYIRAANTKLIERLYLKELVIKKDSIILLKNNYINEQSIIIKDFQNKVNNVNKINLNLQKDLNRTKTRLKVCKWISIGCIGVVGIVMLTK